MLKHKVTATLIDFVSDLVRVTPFLQRKSGLQDPAFTPTVFHKWACMALDNAIRARFTIEEI